MNKQIFSKSLNSHAGEYLLPIWNSNFYFYGITLILSAEQHASNKPSLLFRFCFPILSLSLSASDFCYLIELLISEYDLCSNAGSRSQCTVVTDVNCKASTYH